MGFMPLTTFSPAPGSIKIIDRHGDKHCLHVAKAIVTHMLQLGTSPQEAKVLFRRTVKQHETGSSGNGGPATLPVALA